MTYRNLIAKAEFGLHPSFSVQFPSPEALSEPHALSHLHPRLRPEFGHDTRGLQLDR